MPGGEQLTDTVTADVTGSSDDENIHANQRCIAFGRGLASDFRFERMKSSRIVITGVGLTAPNGNSLAEFRQNLLDGVAGIERMDIRYMGPQLAGVCHYDPLKYQKKKEVRVGTRAGSISIYCAREALADSGVAWDALPKDRVGIYIGCTEHGNVETENEIHNISKFNYDTKFWSHYHNPRTVANNPAGEASLHLGVTGPAYTIGAACAAHRSQTPSVSSAVTEPPSRAVVRLSGFSGRLPASAVAMPPEASVIAAVSPAGPPPTTIAKGLSPLSYLSVMPTSDPLCR